MPRRARASPSTRSTGSAPACSPAGTGALLLGLVWGGQQYPWSERPHVVGALVAAVLLLAAFAFVERRAREPILPFEILRNPIVAGSVACMALVGMAMFGTISYVPLFVQGVIGTSATSSGVVLTPLMLGAVTHVAPHRSARLADRPLPLERGARADRADVGMLLLWRMDTRTTNGEAARNMVIAGIGIGSMMQVFVLSVQNAVSRSRRSAPRPRSRSSGGRWERRSASRSWA